MIKHPLQIVNHLSMCYLQLIIDGYVIIVCSFWIRIFFPLIFLLISKKNINFANIEKIKNIKRLNTKNHE